MSAEGRKWTVIFGAELFGGSMGTPWAPPVGSLRLLNHQHLHRYPARDQFESKLVRQFLFQRLKIGMICTLFIPSQVDIKIAAERSLVDDRVPEGSFQVIRQLLDRRIFHAISPTSERKEE